MRCDALSAFPLVLLAFPSAASANVFSAFAEGSIHLRMHAACASNNVIDFHVASQSSPCDERGFGRAGTASVAGTSGDFARGPFARLAGGTARVADLSFPGVTLSSGVRVAQGVIDWVRFDLNENGVLDAGDMVFEASKFGFSQGTDLRVRVEVSGSFRELLSVEDSEAPSELLGKTPFRLPVDSSASFFAASYGARLLSLSSVGFFGSRVSPFDQDGELARKFHAIPLFGKKVVAYEAVLTVLPAH